MDKDLFSINNKNLTPFFKFLFKKDIDLNIGRKWRVFSGADGGNYNRRFWWGIKSVVPKRQRPLRRDDTLYDL